ncbi:MAG: Fe-S-containing protein [Chloroflexota bacterium]
MRRRTMILGASFMALLVLVLPACGAGVSGGQQIRASWIKAEVAGSEVAIPVSEVERHRIVHFRVGTQTGESSFMAFELDGQLYVRADICPPCGSDSFSLERNVLVCDRCGSVFDARTGEGISGACVAYAKRSVPYKVSGGKIVMNKSDLVAAHQESLRPGR